MRVDYLFFNQLANWIKMFVSDIEKKIIDMVKKSPLGLTSSEIARYLGINRVTLTKYLAVIKEKTLIDFKQFGMAKLWYIPIKLNKEVFLSKIMANLALNFPKKNLKSFFGKAGIGLGKEINQMYKEFYDAKKLSLEQILDVFVDIGKKIGGNFKIREKTKDKITIEIVENTFKDQNKDAMNNVLAGLFGKLTSLNLGYSRTVVGKIQEDGKEKELLTVYLKKEK